MVGATLASECKAAAGFVLKRERERERERERRGPCEKRRAGSKGEKKSIERKQRRDSVGINTRGEKKKKKSVVVYGCMPFLFE